MNKIGGDFAEVYNFEWHRADGATQAEFSNTFYVWPAFFWK